MKFYLKDFLKTSISIENMPLNALKTTGITTSLLATISSTKETERSRTDKRAILLPRSTSRRRWEWEQISKNQWLRKLIQLLIVETLPTLLLKEVLVVLKQLISIWLFLFTQNSLSKVEKLSMNSLVHRSIQLRIEVTQFSIKLSSMVSKVNTMEITESQPIIEGPTQEEMLMAIRLKPQSLQTNTQSTTILLSIWLTQWPSL